MKVKLTNETSKRENKQRHQDQPFENCFRKSDGGAFESVGFSKGSKQVGYARVSTTSQNLEQQFSVLSDAGCDLTFGEKVIPRLQQKSDPNCNGH